MKIDVIHHASIRLENDKVIYIDPYDIRDEKEDADYIFITHDHYDHYDEDSIRKIKKCDTKIIVPRCLEKKEHTLVVDPDNTYKIDNLSFNTIPAYNTEKAYHPKEKNYVGYNILIDGLYYYIMGDTNRTPETEKVKTNICFVPIGGEFTMDVSEASEYINTIKPDIAIPIHYGKIIGNLTLGEDFKNRINKNIEVKLLIKGE